MSTYSRIGRIHIWKPTEAFAGTVGAPRLIVIFGWMDAQLRHEAKYCEMYRKMYPGAEILLKQSKSISFFFPFLERRDSATLAETIHRATGGDGSQTLVHAFSNGGALTFSLTNSAYKKLYGKPLPMRCLAIDSAPGSFYDFKGTVEAFTMPFKNRILKALARLIMYFILYAGSTLSKVTRIPDILTKVRTALIHDTQRCPRVYLYSRHDPIINYKQVELHARASEAAGLPVVTREFSGTGHVAHFRGNPGMYTSAIDKAFKDA